MWTEKTTRHYRTLCDLSRVMISCKFTITECNCFSCSGGAAPLHARGSGYAYGDRCQAGRVTAINGLHRQHVVYIHGPAASCRATTSHATCLTTRYPLVLFTKRKLHRRFRSVPKSATLSDLERPTQWRSFRVISQKTAAFRACTQSNSLKLILRNPTLQIVALCHKGLTHHY